MTQQTATSEFQIKSTADMNYVTGCKLSDNFNPGFTPSDSTISRAKATAAVAELQRMMH